MEHTTRDSKLARLANQTNEFLHSQSDITSTDIAWEDESRTVWWIIVGGTRATVTLEVSE